MKNPCRGLGAVLALLVTAIVCGTAAARPAPFTIVDTLGAATPETVFALPGSGGPSLDPLQWAGPQFTITKHTTIVEIGAFIAGSSPSVQIRPSVNGLPDSTVVIAELSLPTCSGGVVCYVSVAPEKSLKVRLRPGVYFALFTATADQGGYLLGSAQQPFFYQAGQTLLGFLDPTTGRAFTEDALFAAVRILGK
jgi:hypothetical protein